MDRWFRILGAGMVLAAIGCEGPVDRETAEMGARLEEADPAEVGYDPDTLAWFQEGRPVELDGRSWRPVGQAVFERRESLRLAGEFEGMALYAPADETPPYQHLFFPYGHGIWQPLLPLEADEDDPAPVPVEPAAR